jgi:CheY-like chemotaxis protein
MPPNVPLVLIVDDDEDSCAMYAYALLAMGFQPVVADNGEEGFARACAVHPDVVVADVVLPGISGVELTRKLRLDDRTKAAAIIVLTGRTFGSEQQQANEAGQRDLAASGRASIVEPASVAGLV